MLNHVPESALNPLEKIVRFSGLIQAPVPPFITVMKMAGKQGIVLPLLAASFIAIRFAEILFSCQEKEVGRPFN